MNVVLCGMMGVGKTSVGKEIAMLSGRLWFDTDEMIVDKYGKISDIFEYYGEEYFRNVETQVIGELIKGENLVISSGGGLVLREENVAILREAEAKIVYLRAKEETLYHRLSPEDGTRPLLAKRSPEVMKQRIHELLEKRAPTYERVASFIVDTDDKSIREISEEILSLL